MRWDCAACQRGDTQMCLEVSSLIGWNRPGGYAEYVPVPENCLLPVPDDIEDEGPHGEAARRDTGALTYEINVRQYACAGLNFGAFFS